MHLGFMAILALSLIVLTGSVYAEGEGTEDSGGLFVTFKTDKGDIRAELYPEEAPVTVASFVNLAERGYFDGLVFHRVVPGFVIQGGDPTGTGRGGPGYRFEDEFHPSRRHDTAGILSMANSGPRSNGSQFFITHAPTPHLDDRHSVFGKVVSGLDAVNAIHEGDAMKQVVIEGDWSALKAKTKDRIGEWNKVLDEKYPAKG